MIRRHHALGWLACCCALAGCDDEPPRPAEVALPPSASAIPARPVRGEIRGQAFEARDMRLRVVRRGHGREQLDIQLSAASSEDRCGEREPADAPRVWIRITGDTRLQPGRRRRAARDPDASWSVHYQLRQDGEWIGNGDAAALLVIGAVQPDYRISGELSACFADGLGSCVSGTFSADFCPDPTDPDIRDLGRAADAGR